MHREQKCHRCWRQFVSTLLVETCKSHTCVQKSIDSNPFYPVADLINERKRGTVKEEKSRLCRKAKEKKRLDVKNINPKQL